MVIARIESLILNKGMDDAMERAVCYVKAGADGIMIHSKQSEPDEIFEFCKKFKSLYSDIPIVVVPTTYNYITEEELHNKGVKVIIHANHLIRSAFPAMEKTAKEILKNGCSKCVDDVCMPIKQVISFIPVNSEE